MAGQINSLGIGSGVLTSDLLDKLKANERSSTVTPIENKLTLAGQKQTAMQLLSSLASSFKSNVNSLSLDTLYQERTVSGTNTEVSVTADKGTALQSFSITDVSLAKSNVQQSGEFAFTSGFVASGTGTMTITLAGESFDIDYDATTTLSDLKDKITESGANNKLTASILQVGDNSYTFILTSKDTGADQTITITDNAGNLDTKLLSSSHKSGSFTTASDTIAAGGTSGSVHIDINGITADLTYSDTTTLSQLKNMINADPTLKDIISASIVQEGTSDFKLVLNPIGTQAGQTITLTDTSNGLDAKILSTGSTSVAGGLSEVQSASNASFKYNGITVTRSSNTIDDIVLGVKISLLKEGGSANINISQDREPIISELSLFVSSYNTLQSELSSMTTADVDKGTVGIFNGDSSIRNLGREIIKIISSVNKDGNSLAQYGISLSEDGTMSFNQNEFNSKMDTDPNQVSAFFNGSTAVNANGSTTYTAGIFETLNDKLNSYTKFNGILKLLDTGITTEITSLQDDHEKILSLLNARYETMAQRFMQYDALINKINGQASALTQQIEMAIASAKR